MGRTAATAAGGTGDAALQRFAIMLALALLLTVVGVASAQRPDAFLNDLVTLDSSYAPGGSAGTGESVDLYTGSLSFVVTDASLPGNSDLPVAVSRRFVVNAPGHGFGDWQLEVPVITGLVAGDLNHPNSTSPAAGWRSVGRAPADDFKRCTYFGMMPVVVKQNPHGVFSPTEYWSGFHLKVPGAGSQLLLRRGDDNTHAPSAVIENHSSFPVVTKNDWVAACLPSLANSEPGEGFLVVAPDGRRFWFDWLVYTPAQGLFKPTANDTSVTSDDDGAGSADPQTPPGGAILPRLRVRLYATRVEDRFGHWVTYSYDPNNPGQLTDINADDGRHIQMSWTNGHIDTVTAQPQSPDSRTWAYSYDGGSLIGVGLPDGSAWRYDLSALDAHGHGLGTPTCLPHSGPSGLYSNGIILSEGAAIDGNLTTPSGLTVAYHLVDTARGHANTPTDCLYVHFDQYDGQPAYAETYLVWALKTRIESGAGVPNRTWSYDYSGAHGSWANQCNPDCPYTTVATAVTDPEGHVTRYTYSNLFDATEGQLKTIDHCNSVADVADCNAVSGQAIRSESRLYAAAAPGTSASWPASYGPPGGLSSILRSNVDRDTTRMPMVARTTSEGGIDYTWSASTWDSYAKPINIKRESSGPYGDSVSETLAYANNTDLWVLGQFQSRKITAPASAANEYPESRSYHASDATLDTVSRFGRQVASYTWYASGTAAGKLHTVTDANGHTTSYSNYHYGVPQTISYADGTDIGLAANDFGEVLSVQGELNYTTTVTRDDRGRITHKYFPADTGQTWDPITVAYTSSTAGAYGISGRHWSVTRSQGDNRRVTVYDAAMNPVLSAEYDNASSALGKRGHMSWRQFDSAGRTTFVSYPLAYATSLPIFCPGSGSPGIARFYDALGRITETDADSELGILATTTDYASGNEATVTNPRGYATTTTYQAFDQPAYAKALKVTFADDTPASDLDNPYTLIERDIYGKPLHMSQHGTWNGNPISVEHDFAYNDYQQLCLQTSPETGRTGYGYYPNGLRKWTVQALPAAINPCTTVPSSNTITRSYDLRNRLLTIDYPSTTPDTHFTYYDDGKLETASRGNAASPASTWTLTWNHRRLLTNESLVIDEPGLTPDQTFDLGYGYDSEGARDTIRYPSGLTLELAADGLGRPTKAGNYATDITYAPNGTITDLNYANGTSLARTLNTRDFIQTTRYAIGGYNFTHRALSYDENGNLLGIADSASGGCAERDTIFCDGFEGTPPLLGTDARSLAYDVLDRLIGWDSTRYQDASFTYDPLGNVRTRTVGASALAAGGNTPSPGPFNAASYTAMAGVTTYSYSATTNRLTSDGSRAYGHDTRGNVTSVGGFALNRNRANELISDGFGTTYAYDARGWRVKKVVQPAHTSDGTKHTRTFIYDSAHRLMERRDNGTVVDFVTVGRLPIARIKAGAITYIHPDYQNSPLFETNNAGQVTRAPEYGPYGLPANAGAATTAGVPAPDYTGATRDPATGLVYLGARYLLAARFLSPDPVGLNPLSPVGLNRYIYASDNPTRFTDPTGRASVQEMIDKGAEGCGAVSCAGWAALSATWQVLGAEGISQIADKGFSGTSTGQKVGAGVELLSAVPGVALVKGAATAVRGGAAAVRVGQAGEAAVRAAVNIGEKSAIMVGTRTRIPDGLTQTVLSEVKNVKSLSFTSQLRDFSQFSQANGLGFDLYVRPTTRISAPLKDAVNSGFIRRVDIPQ